MKKEESAKDYRESSEKARLRNYYQGAKLGSKQRPLLTLNKEVKNRCWVLHYL
jgi:hypothetical protein